MRIETRHFGEVDIDEEKIVIFDDGIPGFLHCKRFVILNDEDNESSLYWLQSLDDVKAAFVLMNVFSVMPDYNPLIAPEDIADLGEYIAEDFVVYNITVIPDDVKQTRVNLKAPILVNTKLMKGKQVIASNEEYSIRFMIFQELGAKK